MRTRGATEVAAPLAYADTSFLIALYGNDEFTPAARNEVKSGGLPILLCELNRLEFDNALRLLRFRRLVAPRFVANASNALHKDALAGLLHTADLAWPQVFEKASQISERHTAKGGHRAMDILHVAAALMHSVEHFYSFDERQRQLAKQEGLKLNAVR